MLRSRSATISRGALVATVAGILGAGSAAIAVRPADASVSAVAANCQHLMNERHSFPRARRSLLAIKECDMTHTFFATSQSFFNASITNCS